MTTQEINDQSTVAAAYRAFVESRRDDQTEHDIRAAFQALWKGLPASLREEADAWLAEMAALDWPAGPKSKWRKRLSLLRAWASYGPDFIRGSIANRRRELEETSQDAA